MKDDLEPWLTQEPVGKNQPAPSSFAIKLADINAHAKRSVQIAYALGITGAVAAGHGLWHRDAVLTNGKAACESVSKGEQTREEDRHLFRGGIDKVIGECRSLFGIKISDEMYFCSLGNKDEKECAYYKK